MKNELIRLRSITAAENNSMLRGADFKIDKGEAVGLVGGFHSGKRLLMEIIAGTYLPQQGYRFLHGKPVSWESSAEELRVKHLKKNFGLFGPMTIWENIVTYHRKEKWSAGLIWSGQMRTQMKEMLALYGVEADPRTLVEHLTAIQKFAVALIKARLEGTELVLVEDSELEYSVSGFRLMQHLLRLCREQGMSVMLSGIAPSVFTSLLDRVCLIDAGRIIWEEQVQETKQPWEVSACGTMPVRLNIPVERKSPSGAYKRPITVSSSRFSITGESGQFLMLLDPEQELNGIFPVPDISAWSERTVRLHQIDFSYFAHLVKWMSPADNLCFGLAAKTGRFGVIMPHLKRYFLREFVLWTGEGKYLEMRDCESLVIGERIKLAAFRLKMDRPDVIVFRHFQLLDQASREIVLPVLSDLLHEGTVLVGISTLDNFSDFADGYFLMMDGRCSERMNYRQIRAILDGNEENGT